MMTGGAAAAPPPPTYGSNAAAPPQSTYITPDQLQPLFLSGLRPDLGYFTGPLNPTMLPPQLPPPR